MFRVHHLFQIVLLLISYLSSASDGSIAFIENKGQWDKEIQFLAQIPGGSLLVYKDRLVYHFVSGEDTDHSHTHLHGNASSPHGGQLKKAMDIVTVAFESTNQEIKLEGLQEKGYRHNYYMGNDVARHAEGCKIFSSVRFENLYDGIDLKLYAKNGNLKYDLEVAKFADPSKIKMTYLGDFDMFLEDGCSFIDLGHSSLMEDRPVAYQVDGECLIDYVNCNFRLSNQTLGFNLSEDYNPGHALVIDPELIFSTFSGSVSDNWGYTACFDDDGNLYSGGIVFGSNFPSSIRPFGDGVIDIGILKYDSSGSQLLYATFIGGSGNESPHSLIVNNANELVIMGTTGSANYPVSGGAYDDTFNGGTLFSIFGSYDQGSDIVLTKLDEQGRLIASTFVGGPGNDGILKMTEVGDYQNELIYNYGDYQRGDVIIDEDDNVYVASSTDADGFPTNSTIQNAYSGGNSDAVVFSLDSDLTTLRWSTYFGGTADDAAYSVKLDSSDQVLIGGGTSSSDLPTSSDALIQTYSGNRDGFLSILNVTGDSIVASTYLGTSNYDQVYFIDIDGEQKVYATGQTSGVYPVTPGTYSNPNSSQFIHKLDKTLKSTEFSTVFGSGSRIPNISPTAFLANECDNIFVSGWGGAINNGFGAPTEGFGNTRGMPVTSNALFSTTDGDDFYLMVLSADGSELLYGTFYGSTNNGGDHVDGGTSRFDKRGIIYQSVCSCGGSSDDFPTTDGAWSTVNRGVNSEGIERCNNAAFKFDLASLIARFDIRDEDGVLNVSSGCLPFTATFINQSIGGEEFDWEFGDGTTSNESNEVSHMYESAGTYTITLTVTDPNTCQVQDVVSKDLVIFGDAISISEDTRICNGSTVRLSAGGGLSYEWEPRNGLNDAFSATPIASPTTTTVYKVTITTPNGCVKEDSVEVEVLTTYEESFEVTPRYTCEQVVYEITNFTEYEGNFLWEFGDGTISTELEPIHSYENAGAYTINLSLPDEDCFIDLSRTVFYEEVFVPNVFTPNSDGVNDFFEIRSNLEVSLKVFDRSGSKLYENADYRNDWDGDDLASGIYFYQLTFPGDQKCGGWLQLLR